MGEAANRLSTGAALMTAAEGGSAKAEDVRKHLDFIQAVVTMMSAASANAKAWLLPIVTATYGYALTQHAGTVALLGVLAAGLFGFLDANYLRQEQAYRALYDAVANGTRDVPLFSLDVAHASDPTPEPVTRWERTLARLHCWIPRGRVWASWSIAPFYGVLLLVGMAIFMAA